jgi:hypothetical protein
MKRLIVEITDEAFAVVEMEQKRRERLKGVRVSQGEIVDALLLNLGEVLLTHSDDAEVE